MTRAWWSANISPAAGHSWRWRELANTASQVLFVQSKYTFYTTHNAEKDANNLTTIRDTSEISLGMDKAGNIISLIQFAATIPIIAAQSQNLITTPFRYSSMFSVFCRIYVDPCTSVSAYAREFHRVGDSQFQFNHNCIFIWFPPIWCRRPVVSTFFCFSWYF